MLCSIKGNFMLSRFWSLVQVRLKYVVILYADLRNKFLDGAFVTKQNGAVIFLAYLLWTMVVFLAFIGYWFLSFYLFIYSFWGEWSCIYQLYIELKVVLIAYCSLLESPTFIGDLGSYLCLQGINYRRGIVMFYHFDRNSQASKVLPQCYSVSGKWSKYCCMHCWNKLRK